jgi:hypothetical protein
MTMIKELRRGYDHRRAPRGRRLPGLPANVTPAD